MSERNIVEEFYITHHRPKFPVEFNFKNSEEIWKKNNVAGFVALQFLPNILLKNS
jgi:hypothetical protein